MNNATASLQSTISFLLLTTLCSTISPSHMHTLSKGMAKKKGSALSAAQYNKYSKCFYSFASKKNKCQFINEQKWVGFPDFAVRKKYLVWLLFLESVRTDMEIYCRRFTHVAVQKALVL